MEIDELKSRKAQLESDITDLIAKFEEECKVDVISCYYSKTADVFVDDISNPLAKSCRRKTSITVTL